MARYGLRERPAPFCRLRRSVRGDSFPGDRRLEVQDMYQFTPQDVFLVVFSGVVIIAYFVNRAHCYDLKRNNHEAH
jgi:hypothetical protein